MQNTNVMTLLKSTPLFAGADEKRLSDLLSASVLRDYIKGERVSGKDPALYVVTRGSVCVYRTESGQRVIINTINEGGVFGAAQLFCKDPAFSYTKAACACTCLQIPGTEITKLLETDPIFTLNYVSFLSDRIRFLNTKIASFTAGSGEKTLAAYLLSASEDRASVKIDRNMSSLSQFLNISRPTLYRAFTSLQNQGIIEKAGKEVRIISKEKLKSI